MSRDIFISYSTADEPTALRICQLLEENGVSCWIASRDLSGGPRPWSGTLTEAICESRVVLVVVSANSNASQHVAREVEYADSNRIPLIAFCIEEVAPAGDIAFFLHNKQWLNAFSESLESVVPRIVEAVVGTLPTSTPPSPPPSRLRMWLRPHRRKLGLGAAGVIAAVLTFALWPCRHAYHVHVTVLDTGKRPVEDALISSIPRHEIRKTPGGWQLDLPKTATPADGKLTIYASSSNLILNGSVELRLGRSCDPAVAIHLKPAETGEVRGTVVDSAGISLAGARVNVVGFESEAVITIAGGGFKLPAHVPDGGELRLHVEKKGFKPVTQLHFAGPEPATVTLAK